MRPVNEIRCYIVTLPLISWAHKQNDPWTWSFLCRKRFPRPRLQRKPLVSDPGMYHGTCVTHVSWYMPESLTRGGRENVPGIHDACTTRNFAYLVRGQCTVLDLKLTMSYFIYIWLWIHFPWSDSVIQCTHVSWCMSGSLTRRGRTNVILRIG